MLQINNNFLHRIQYRKKMKFFVSDTQMGRQIHKKTNMDEQGSQNQNVFYNIYHPTNKIQCDICKKDISKHTKVLTPDNDYCVGCFSNLEAFPQFYNVINKLDYPLFDVQWTADEELLMFQGLEKHGFGNWSQIAEFMGTSKTRQQVQHHYTSVYLQSPNFIPANRQILSKRDAQTKKLNKQSTNKIFKRKSRQQTSNVKNQRSYLTVNHHQTNNNTKTGANPAEIIGYMPKRGDFQVEYDNEAQLLLAQMQFNDDDTEEQKQMKFNLINIYNHKLTERIRRKEFVITRNLLDLRQLSRIQKMRSKQQKQIYNIMRVFARFSSAEQHEHLVQGIIRQKQIRQRIQQLKQFKKKGCKTLAQVQQQLQNKRRKDEKIRRKGQQIGQLSNYDLNKTRRTTKTPTIDRTEKRSTYMSRQEDELCKKLNLSSKNYIQIKQKIIRESIKQGILQKDSISRLFKIDRGTLDSIFDYLVQKQDIIGR